VVLSRFISSRNRLHYYRVTVASSTSWAIASLALQYRGHRVLRRLYASVASASVASVALLFPIPLAVPLGLEEYSANDQDASPVSAQERNTFNTCAAWRVSASSLTVLLGLSTVTSSRISTRAGALSLGGRFTTDHVRHNVYMSSAIRRRQDPKHDSQTRRGASGNGNKSDGRSNNHLYMEQLQTYFRVYRKVLHYGNFA
jgi:hypothetical protein